jgi:hypothetical protein
MQKTYDTEDGVSPDHRAPRRRMLELCRRARDGDLGFDELIREFPRGAPADPYLYIAYGDLVDGVEHYPFTLMGKPDLGAWLGSEMHTNLSLHILLLEGDESSADACRLYDVVQPRLPAVPAKISRWVAEARAEIAVESGAPWKGGIDAS